MADNDKTIFVERETYSKNDKEYYTYFIKGNVRGKDVKIGIAPPDIGGYTSLDIGVRGREHAPACSQAFRDSRRQDQESHKGQYVRGGVQRRSDGQDVRV